MKYRKKPIIVDAEPYKKGLEDGFECHNGWGCCPSNCEKHNCECYTPYINTLEGKMYINSDDMIITGVKGERYPCKKDIFELTYEEERVKRYELEKDEMELLYHFARETNLLYLSSKFKDKFDKETIQDLDLLFSKIYKKYESDFR